MKPPQQQQTEQSSNSPVLPNQSFCLDIEGNNTDVVCASFTDRDFIMVTQYRKAGTLVSVSVEKSASKPLVEPTYTTKVLMGKDEDLTHVFSRAIAETVYKCRESVAGGDAPNPSTNLKPLLCTLALKEPTPAALNQIVNVIKSCSLWAK